MQSRKSRDSRKSFERLAQGYMYNHVDALFHQSVAYTRLVPPMNRNEVQKQITHWSPARFIIAAWLSINTKIEMRPKSVSILLPTSWVSGLVDLFSTILQLRTSIKLHLVKAVRGPFISVALSCISPRLRSKHQATRSRPIRNSVSW